MVTPRGGAGRWRGRDGMIPVAVRERCFRYESSAPNERAVLSLEISVQEVGAQKQEHCSRCCSVL
ncbi:protein of unknown function [Streptomyces sp. KY75]|nr:protein of unknown function [Streptomyces sp. KY75]CAD5991442.1 protein of unknown function [Streptomyces sp. KY70]